MGTLERFDVNPTGLTALRSIAGTSTPWGIGGGLTTADATTNGEFERIFRGTNTTGGVSMPKAKLILQVRPADCP